MINLARITNVVNICRIRKVKALILLWAISSILTSCSTSHVPNMMQELPVAEKYFSEPLIINPSEPSEFRLLSDIINPRTILLDSYYGQPSLANIEILRFLKTIGVEEIVLIDSESSIEEKDVISRIIDLRKINEVPWVKREIPEEKQGG